MEDNNLNNGSGLDAADAKDEMGQPDSGRQPDSQPDNSGQPYGWDQSGTDSSGQSFYGGNTYQQPYGQNQTGNTYQQPYGRNQTGNTYQQPYGQNQTENTYQQSYGQYQAGGGYQQPSGGNDAGGSDQSYGGGYTEGGSQQYQNREQGNGSYQTYNQPGGPYQQYQQTQNQNGRSYYENQTGGGLHPDQFQKRNSSGNGFGIASMILGIMSLVLFCTCLNIPLSVAAVIFGGLHLGRSTEGRAMAVTGIVSAILSVIAFIVTLVLLWGPFQSFYWEVIQEMPYSSEYDGDYDYESDYDDLFDFPFRDDSGYDPNGLPFKPMSWTPPHDTPGR